MGNLARGERLIFREKVQTNGHWIDEDLDGIFFPQNKEYVNTSNLEKLIANSMNKKMIIVKSTYPLIIQEKLVKEPTISKKQSL